MLCPSRATTRHSGRLDNEAFQQPVGRALPMIDTQMKPLLIEDNPTLQATLQRTLERRGIQVLTCGDRSLALWQANLPDAALLDLSLPGRDGLQVLGEALTAVLKTPGIILTARGTVGDRIIGLNTGADDYLPKPFDLDELEARICALVQHPDRPRQRSGLSR